MRSTQEVDRAWMYLASGPAVFLANKKGEFLCEGPYERLDLPAEAPDDETEAAVRVFLTLDECGQYCRQWRELLDVGPNNKGIVPIKTTLKGVWKHLKHIVDNSYVDYRVPPRIDLCRFVAGEPVVIDTLFSEWEELH